MFSLGSFTIAELRHLTNRPVVLPGETVPVPLRYRLEWLSQRETDLRPRERPRLVQKLRLVFARG